MLYSCPAQYLETASSIEEKIVKLDVIINGLYDAAIRATESGEFEEYIIDTGQSRIKTIYRDMTHLEQSIIAFERIRQRLINKINGSSVILKNKYSNIPKR